MTTTTPFASGSDLDARPTDRDAALAGASAAVRAWARWHIWPTVTETVTVDGKGGVTLMLPTLHLIDVTGVTDDGVAVPDVEWSAAGFVRAAGHRWSTRLRGVTATITHGHPVLPAEILQVVLDAAASGLAASAMAGIEREQAGPFSTSYRAATAALSPASASLVSAYRLPPEA